MNERIRELAEQAGCAIDGMGYGEGNVEGLAELIVRECANEILKWKSEPFPFDPEFAAKLIKEHFEIK